jgi:hypothetical protein
MKAGLVRLALSRTRRSRMPLLHNPQSAPSLALSQSCTAEACAQLREGFAKTRRDVIGGRDEAAKNYGIDVVSDERLQDFDRRFELRIGWPGQALGPRHEAGQRTRFIQAGCRFHIERVCLVGIVVEDLLFEPLGIRAKTVTKRTERGSRRRADAAHQRQCAPEGSPSPTLVRPGAARLNLRKYSVRFLFSDGHA